MSLLIALVRHGETGWNAERRYQGHKDIPLNENGRRQALALGEHMGDWNILAIYSSDLARARDTVAPIAGRRALPIRLDPRLREMAFGEWEGLTADEISGRHPDFYGQWMRDPVSLKPQGGETLTEMRDRVVSSLGDILNETLPIVCGCGHGAPHSPGGGDPVVVVASHAGPVRAMICTVMGRPLTEFWSVPAGSGSYSLMRAVDSPGAGRGSRGVRALRVEDTGVVPGVMPGSRA